MAAVDLRFSKLPTNGASADLIFGNEDDLSGDYNVQLEIPLPTPTFVASVAGYREVTVEIALPTPTFACLAEYDIFVSRPTVGQTTTSHQDAIDVRPGVQDRAQANDRLRSSVSPGHTHAQMLDVGFQHVQADSLEPLRQKIDTSHTEADPLRSQVGTSTQEMIHDRRLSISTAHAEMIDLRAAITTSSQDRYRDRRPSVSSAHQTAQALRRMLHEHTQSAVSVRKTWRTSAQEAMRPPAGMYVPPIPPDPDPCYTPSAHLLFKDGATVNGNLLFICENHLPPEPPAGVVVPVRRVYMVINNVSLRKVDGDIELPAYSMSLTIDVESWTWGFSASLPSTCLPHLQPGLGEPPVELEAEINGNLYRVLAENFTRERVFGNSSIRVNGRGKSALLASPSSPILTFANSEERTAQQLMADVLTFNGIPIGWDIDWQLEDWLVPAGAFNVRGAYIDGLNAIVGAAGAYLQPHPTSQELSALLRYPVAPWDWGEVEPDFELPSAVTTREGIEWVDKPRYNRVFVSGTSQGVLGRVTREGTAGDLAAPMVTDALITSAIAARQRGLSILADTGRQAMVSLRLPVLEETGVIAPGKFVRYVDGGDERIGIVRSTSVEVSYPDVWQSLQVETHE